MSRSKPIPFPQRLGKNAFEHQIGLASGPAPTIGANQRILVNKLQTPRRWDVIVYHSTEPSGTPYCKRLVGLPGEWLRFEHGNLFVNGKPVTAPAVVAGKYRDDLQFTSRLFKYHDGQMIKLEKDEIFVIGDNVNLSYDSRMVGPLKRSSIIGVADFVYWPLNRFAFLR